MSSLKGIDYDSRCQKYRARLTRNGCVYHLGYFVNKNDAIKARKKAEEEFEKGNKIDFLHSYSTSSVPPEIEDDPYLFFLSIGDPSNESSPEKNIRLSVLVQAVKDFLTDKDRESQKNARDWFANKTESAETYTFEDVCEILSIDSSYVRKCLKKSARNKKKVLSRIGRRLVRSYSPSGSNPNNQ